LAGIGDRSIMHVVMTSHIIGLFHARLIGTKQQAEPIDQRSDTHQERTRQSDEPRTGVLSTSIYLRLLTVRRSDTWRTVVPKKAAKRQQ